MPTDELRARRAGRREANLRELNERIVRAQHDAGNGHEQLRLVCECARTDCEENIDVPASVFEDARATGNRFIIAKGHILHDIERETATGDGWVVVQKVGPAAAAAAEELR